LNDPVRRSLKSNSSSFMAAVRVQCGQEVRFGYVLYVTSASPLVW
jgi:hypothetical protein